MATGDGEEETTSQRSESLWTNILYATIRDTHTMM